MQPIQYFLLLENMFSIPYLAIIWYNLPHGEFKQMKQTYLVHYNQNLDKEQSRELEICVEEVGECPCCHFATSPTYMDGFLISSKDDGIPVTAFLVLYCTKCKNIYIAKYISTSGASNLKLDFVFPRQANLKIFSDGINELSPEFVSIYNQAQESESNINTQGLAGLGYRKALEFLIKDYLIKVQHQDKDTIIKLELNDCINKIKDDELKSLAKASVWIGNDETHYFRKNPEYDAEDLKLFIECLLHNIDREYIIQKAKKLIQSKKS